MTQELTWICATCRTEQNGDRVKHFESKHYFKPKLEQAIIRQIETTPTQDFDFWYHECVTETVCPECRTNTKMFMSATKKSVRIECLNPECKTVLFYRKIKL